MCFVFGEDINSNSFLCLSSLHSLSCIERNKLKRKKKGTKAEMIQIPLPMRLLVVGPSSSGKSSFIATMIKKRKELFDKEFQKIYYCSKFETSVPPELADEKSIIFHKGIPDEEMIENKEALEEGRHVLIVLDDLHENSLNSDLVSMLFTQLSIAHCKKV